MYTYIYIYIHAAVVSFQVGWASPPLAPHCFPWPLCLAKVNMHVCALHAFFTKCEAVCAVKL